MARRRSRILCAITCHAHWSWYGELSDIPRDGLLDSVPIVIRTRTVLGPVRSCIIMTPVLSLVCYEVFCFKFKFCFAVRDTAYEYEFTMFSVLRLHFDLCLVFGVCFDTKV